MNEVLFLYSGPGKYALTKRDVVEIVNHTEFAGQPKKDAAAYRSFCVDPVADLVDGVWIVQCNVLTNKGSVEKCTLKLTTGKLLEIRSVETKEVAKPHSFYWSRF